jgi:hypothetical protein
MDLGMACERRSFFCRRWSEAWGIYAAPATKLSKKTIYCWIPWPFQGTKDSKKEVDGGLPQGQRYFVTNKAIFSGSFVIAIGRGHPVLTTSQPSKARWAGCPSLAQAKLLLQRYPAVMERWRKVCLKYFAMQSHMVKMFVDCWQCLIDARFSDNGRDNSLTRIVGWRIAGGARCIELMGGTALRHCGESARPSGGYALCGWWILGGMRTSCWIIELGWNGWGPLGRKNDRN